MNMLMEVALLVGSIFAQSKWRAIPDSLSRLPFTSSTIPGPSGTENGGTGRSSNDHRILLNILYWLGLFVPA